MGKVILHETKFFPEEYYWEYPVLPSNHDLDHLRYSPGSIYESAIQTVSAYPKSLFLITLCFSHILSVLGLVPLYVICLNTKGIWGQTIKPQVAMVQRVYLKWVSTTCDRLLFSIYLLFYHTEELYLQFKINFTYELKSIMPPKIKKIHTVKCDFVHHIPELLIKSHFTLKKVSLAPWLSEHSRVHQVCIHKKPQNLIKWKCFARKAAQMSWYYILCFSGNNYIFMGKKCAWIDLRHSVFLFKVLALPHSPKHPSKTILIKLKTVS